MFMNGYGKELMGSSTPIASPVRTRMATPEELAALDIALKKKYGERKKPAPKKIGVICGGYRSGKHGGTGNPHREKAMNAEVR